MFTIQNGPELKVSLVITTYNRPDALELILRSVFRQTVLPDEIVIGDDGSGPATREVIERMRKESPVPVVHVWHEDKGIRISEIRNKAILASSGDYIIQIDGDIVLERHFIGDPLSVAEPGRFVTGSRVSLSQRASRRLLAGRRQPDWRVVRLGYIWNFVRLWPMRRLMQHRYKQEDHWYVRGCNMAFWRKDFFAANGYNEQIVNWGHEDSELTFRMGNAGIKKSFLKFAGVAFHLYHENASRAYEQGHRQIVADVCRTARTRCEYGVDRHIGDNSYRVDR